MLLSDYQIHYSTLGISVFFLLIPLKKTPLFQFNNWFIFFIQIHQSASCCLQGPSFACCQHFYADGCCVMPSQTLAPRKFRYVSLGTRRKTTKAALRFFTTVCGGQCVTMTSPSQLPTWCVERLASWMQSLGRPLQSMEREKVRKLIYCLKPEVRFFLFCFWGCLHLTETPLSYILLKPLNKVPALSELLVPLLQTWHKHDFWRWRGGNGNSEHVNQTLTST